MVLNDNQERALLLIQKYQYLKGRAKRQKEKAIEIRENAASIHGNLTGDRVQTSFSGHSKIENAVVMAQSIEEDAKDCEARALKLKEEILGLLSRIDDIERKVIIGHYFKRMTIRAVAEKVERGERQVHRIRKNALEHIGELMIVD